MKQKVIWSAQLLLVLLCALGLKAFYSSAAADDLLWILTPTTVLVELLSGRSFEFESYAGYMSSDHRFVIAVPCAGVNFLITAFLMLALRRLWRERFQPVSWFFLPVTVVLAYVATLLANTTRIWFALEVQAGSAWLTWLTHNQLHRLEGIVIYFLFLMLLFVLTERFETASPRTFARASLFPLSIYYAVTLGIPLVNGSYHRGTAFWEHSAFVLVLPLLVILPLVLFFLAKSNKRDQPNGTWSFLKLPENYDPKTAYPPRCSVVAGDFHSAGSGPGTTLHATSNVADRDRTKHIH
ncbi:MAG TPA: exosortase K [Pyrinomonadaceae bacterium]|nr:exosortase K [Pyrinomonadaceae bacterium]